MIREMNNEIPPEWVHSKVTLAEIEGPNKAHDLICPEDRQEWRDFKSNINETDELWYFTSPQESFLHLAGRMGYVIIRNGKQVESYLIFMN